MSCDSNGSELFHLDLGERSLFNDLDEELFEDVFCENSPEKQDDELIDLAICESSVNPKDVLISPADFQLLSVIGRGGYGKVFLCRKITPPDKNQLFALKVLKKASLLHSKKDAIHTRSERDILQKISHPFLVQLYYAFQTPGKLYLCLEYLPGGELFRHMERENTFLEDEAIFYLAEIILAMGHLHSLGIIYRDLKPENILLDENGHVKLTDFGLSKHALDDCNQITNTFCGTIEYMAPEIILRKGHNKSVDWWSLGCLMYDLLVGHSPFSAANRKKISEKILSGKFNLPSFLTQDAKNLIKGLLKISMKDRLGSDKSDAVAIQNHKFFSKTNWDKVYGKKYDPPYKPHLKSESDVSQFDTKFTNERPIETPEDDEAGLHIIKAPYSPTIDQYFDGFTYFPKDKDFIYNCKPRSQVNND